MEVETLTLPSSPEDAIESLEALDLELVCLPMFEDLRPPRGLAAWIDWRTDGWLSRLLGSERFEPVSGGRLLTPVARTGWATGAVLIGQGPWSAWDDARARAYIDEARAATRDLSVSRVGLEVPRWTTPGGESERGEAGHVGDLEDPGGISRIQEMAREGWGAVTTSTPVRLRLIVSDFDAASPR